MVLRRLEMPKEVPPIPRHGVVVDTLPSGNVVDVGDDMVRGLEQRLSRVEDEDTSPRLTKLALDVKDLTWIEMISVAVFVAKRVSTKEVVVDHHVVATALHEWQQSLLDPPETVENEPRE